MIRDRSTVNLPSGLSEALRAELEGAALYG
jgi:hypothetical protein